MSVVRMQVGRVVAAVAVVGAVISGCGGPSQASTAVFIGDDAVPLERIQTQLDSALAKEDQIAQLTAQGRTTADLARSIVTRAVMHDLLARRAAEDSVAITDAQVDAQIAEYGGSDALLNRLPYDLPMLREVVRDELIAAELAQRVVGGLEVTADIVAATSPDDADAKAAALQAGGPQADALFGDGTTSRRAVPLSAASSPEDASTAVFGSPVGTVLALPYDEQGTWLVARIVGRRTDAPSDPSVATSFSQAQLIAIGHRMLQSTAEEVGIRVNPRYGVWDPIQLRIVAEDQQVGTILPPVAS